MRRALDLDIATGAERDAFTLWQLEHELLDEGGDVVVRADFARPALHAEDLVRNLDFHVLLDLHLAGEAASLAGFAAIDVPRLRREDRAATFADCDLADAAGSLSTTGGGNEDLIVGQRVEQRATGGRRKRLVRIAINEDGDVTALHEARARGHQDHDEREHQAREHPNPSANCSKIHSNELLGSVFVNVCPGRSANA